MDVLLGSSLIRRVQHHGGKNLDLSVGFYSVCEFQQNVFRGSRGSVCACSGELQVAENHTSPGTGAGQKEDKQLSQTRGCVF